MRAKQEEDKQGQKFAEDVKVMTTEGPTIVTANRGDGDVSLRWPGHGDPFAVYTVPITDVWLSSDYPDDD